MALLSNNLSLIIVNYIYLDEHKARLPSDMTYVTPAYIRKFRKWLFFDNICEIKLISLYIISIGYLHNFHFIIIVFVIIHYLNLLITN
jgi:hypothetical protein